MSQDPMADDPMERLIQDMEQRLAYGQDLNLNALAQEYGLPLDDVEACFAAVSMLQETTSSVPNQLGPYKILAELGQGGMGQVFRAKHEYGFLAAVKIIPSHLSGPQLKRRFGREVQAMTQLKHPNLVEFYEFGEDQGYPYIAMELLEGETLAETLKRRGPLTYQRALTWIASLTDCVRAVHGQGLLHRDIKPQNIFIDSDQQPRLMDFGLVKDLSREHSAMTQVGEFLGTFGFASPEQIRGDLKLIDQRTDIYGLGATLYAMLSGQSPRPKQGPKRGLGMLSEQVSALSEPIPAIQRSDIPVALKAVCMRCLQLKPSQRYQTAEELLRALHAAARPPSHR